MKRNWIISYFRQHRSGIFCFFIFCLSYHLLSWNVKNFLPLLNLGYNCCFLLRKSFLSYEEWNNYCWNEYSNGYCYSSSCVGYC